MSGKSDPKTEVMQGQTSTTLLRTLFLRFQQCLEFVVRSTARKRELNVNFSCMASNVVA